MAIFLILTGATEYIQFGGTCLWGHVGEGAAREEATLQTIGRAGETLRLASQLKDKLKAHSMGQKSEGIYT